MIHHEVEIAEISQLKTPTGLDAGTTAGSILVEPPITPGESFVAAIRGRDGYGVRLYHVVTTSETTVFVAESTLNTAENRLNAIHTVANRIKRLADSPEETISLLSENPFPSPDQGQSQLAPRYR
jgi:hypothetical protein